MSKRKTRWLPPPVGMTLTATLKAMPAAIWAVYGYEPRMAARYSFATLIDAWAAAINAGERI